ncbi:hypothetical protein K505DRAFT_400780 [Melanomma pulvis-pyrius CBS 109.77]|uniref:Uncharacterized protein n=1 Tax=Melanomma pulvis-pyrius CBS 109.77 TaxID=1314802 RepID=A0A6A6WP44_9PLEO|nr:hypothetical protein K505DRAFT_400780 [Melanomma pulvis-pyrius CBS 109.77]
MAPPAVSRTAHSSTHGLLPLKNGARSFARASSPPHTARSMPSPCPSPSPSPSINSVYTAHSPPARRPRRRLHVPSAHSATANTASQHGQPPELLQRRRSRCRPVLNLKAHIPPAHARLESSAFMRACTRSLLCLPCLPGRRVSPPRPPPPAARVACSPAQSSLPLSWQFHLMLLAAPARVVGLCVAISCAKTLPRRPRWPPGRVSWPGMPVSPA